MIVASSGPGKTAPKLLNDFLNFDPIHCNPRTNYLTKHTPPVGEGQQLGPHIGGCKHDYSLKPQQSETPTFDAPSAGSTAYKVAVCCKKCRLHADARISYAHSTSPCPKAEFPLHHFLKKEGSDVTTPDRIVYAWQCSAPECSAYLEIGYRMARLADKDIQLLTDPHRLQKRYEDMVNHYAEREGLRRATRVEPLSRLRKYIKDGLDTSGERKVIQPRNKRFGEAFGVNGGECSELLQRLGFEYKIFEEDDGGQGPWALPNPARVDDRVRADGSSQRELLEDVEKELLAVMARISSDSSLPNPSSAEGWHSADKDIERLLAAQNYPRFSSLRRTHSSPEELPYFASLGALPDFADTLVEFAFDRQSLCDRVRRPYYFECLQMIRRSRNTEALSTKVAMLESEGLVSRQDLHKAYDALDIRHNEGNDASDERILNLYQVRVSDLGTSAARDAREALGTIGRYRNSDRLTKASMQTLETYQDALEWLGHSVDVSTPDDTIIAVAGARKAESDENREMADKAVSIIARERKSNALNQFVAGAQPGAYQMSPDEALRYVGVEEQWSNVDKSMLQSVFDVARIDRPGDQTEKAIAILQQAMAGQESSHAPNTWPVGLKSHGNTCYLNSILQYYFSIKPFRELILNYDKHKLDTNRYAEKHERVGHTHLSLLEIKGGQRFAEDLNELFQRMIKDPGEHVLPSQELICRAFLKPKDYALLNKDKQEIKSAVEEGQNGHLENAIDESLSTDAPATLTTPAQSQQVHSDASSTTLRGDDDDINMNGDSPPTPPESPSIKTKQPVEERPPPLPARRFSTSRDQAIALAEEKAKSQQDVTEVHDSITWLLRAGLEPKGSDELGEQLDDLNDLFSYSISKTTVKNGKAGKQEKLLDTSVLLPPPSETTSLYSMLDGVFDLQAAGEEAQDGTTTDSYQSLVTLPKLLQINISRIAWDKDRGGYKSEVSTELYDELYLDRYIDTSHPDTLARRKACWSWRKQLHALKKEKTALSGISNKVNGGDATDQTAKYLNDLVDINGDLESVGIEGIDVDRELPRVLTKDAIEQTKRLLEIEHELADLQAKLKDQFSDQKAIKYRLAAVFFHRGTFGSGHYWIYIHDFQNDIWRLYNDERVEEFSEMDKLFKANIWSHGTPTLACYVKDELKDELIQPVCRAPEKAATPPQAPQPDVEMKGSEDDLPPSMPTEPRQQLSAPQSTVTEGGTVEWDTPRQVSSGDGVW